MIDISEWREFKVNDLFNMINKTAKNNKYDKFKEPEGDYSIPALSSLAVNKSHGFYVKEDDHDLIDKICLSVTSNGVNAGTVFVQDKPFAIVQDAYAIFIKDKELNYEAYQFLSVVLEKLLINKYGYNEKATWNKVKNEYILLPTKHNEPDWEYMEEYIKDLQEKNEEKLKIFKEIPDNKRPLDKVEWRSFNLADLFDIEQSKGDIQYIRCLEGNIPLVSSGNDDNNSIVGYIESGDGIAEIFKAGSITIDMFGAANYQKDDFYAVSHGRVTILKPKKKLKESALLFVSACLNKKFKNMCSYQNMCSMKLLLRENIKLPAIYNEKEKKYEPDWTYMEEFIEKRQEKIIEKLQELKSSETK